MTTIDLYQKYNETLNAAIAAGAKASAAGARYVDWLTSSDEVPTMEELEALEDRIEWLKACDEFAAAKEISYKARAAYRNSINN